MLITILPGSGYDIKKFCDKGISLKDENAKRYDGYLYANGQTYPTSMQVSLGVCADLSAEPEYLRLLLPTPLEIAGEQRSTLLIKNYCFDPTMCPAGKSVLTVLLSAKHAAWEEAAKDPGGYRHEKDQVSAAVISALERRFPAIRGKVEAVGVATPLTYSRYTGAWKGGYMDWLSTPDMPVVDPPSVLPGLSGFRMAGQWAYPRGGLPVALMTARGAIMKICAEDGREFAEAAK